MMRRALRRAGLTLLPAVAAAGIFGGGVVAGPGVATQNAPPDAPTSLCAQAVADVAGYIDTLEIGVDNGKGPGRDLELGERLYRENCARCHGATGEGDADSFVPRVQAQHYNYLVTQFQWIREGKRRNANAEMVAQIQGFNELETQAVLDYVSRLEPPSELQAPPDWQNPDFPNWRWR